MSRDRRALIEVRGAHGERWVVSGPGMGEQGVELGRDPEGLFDEAPFTTVWQQSASQEGATFVMSNVEPLDIVLEFHIYGDPSRGMSWEAVESAFYGSFGVDPHADLAEIAVTTLAGERRLGVVKMERSKQVAAFDPRINGYSKLILTLRAPWPYWSGVRHLSTFSTAASNGSGTVEVFNPTDVPMWLRWTATAPGRWTIPDRDWVGGKTSRTITTPTLAPAQNLTVDTYPLHETYVASDGSNIAGRFGGVDFLYPVPAHTPRTSLSVALTGGSTVRKNSIQCEMVENWQRAAGGAMQW